MLTLKNQFDVLTRRWKKETFVISSMTEMCEHEAYQQIIQMGFIVVPLILRNLRDDGGFWFYALQVLTENDPIPAADAGNYMAMRQAWLEWGIENGLLDELYPIG